MGDNIIENIEINDGKLTIDIKRKKDECVIDKLYMTEVLKVNGEISLYLNIIKEVLDGAVTFSDNGNMTVKKLKKVSDNLIVDEKYIEKREKINDILKYMFYHQDNNKKRIMYEKKLDKSYDDLNNYISIKIMDTIYPELKIITIPYQKGDSKMNIKFYKELLDELLESNKINDITEEQKEKFFEKYNLLTKDVFHYYELTLNSQNQSGIIYLKEKYPNNFIISELLDSKIKYIDLRRKEYEDRYWGLCSVFTAFYGVENNDIKQEIEAMTDMERRSKFVEKYHKQIEDCEDKYLKLVDEYSQKLYIKEECEIEQ